jgi:hypothetical protein
MQTNLVSNKHLDRAWEELMMRSFIGMVPTRVDLFLFDIEMLFREELQTLNYQCLFRNGSLELLTLFHIL